MKGRCIEGSGGKGLNEADGSGIEEMVRHRARTGRVREWREI